MLRNLVLGIFGLVALLFAIGCQNTHSENELTIIKPPKIDSSSVSIIPFNNAYHDIFDSTYQSTTLNSAELSLIDSLLTTHVKIKGVKVKDYFKQMVPVENKAGEKIVWINALCKTNNDNWKHHIIAVDDGGSCYFQIKFNLTTNLHYDLIVNGEG